LDGSNLLEQLPNISRTPANIIQSVSIIFNGSNDKNNFPQFSLHFGEISKTFWIFHFLFNLSQSAFPFSIHFFEFISAFPLLVCTLKLSDRSTAVATNCVGFNAFHIHDFSSSTSAALPYLSCTRTLYKKCVKIVWNSFFSLCLRGVYIKTLVVYLRSFKHIATEGGWSERQGNVFALRRLEGSCVLLR
jgi:hypothetical protein